MTKSSMDYTCEECSLYDGMCQNQDSDHYQHTIGMLHPACDDMELKIDPRIACGE